MQKRTSRVLSAEHKVEFKRGDEKNEEGENNGGESLLQKVHHDCKENVTCEKSVSLVSSSQSSLMSNEELSQELPLDTHPDCQGDDSSSNCVQLQQDILIRVKSNCPK